MSESASIPDLPHSHEFPESDPADSAEEDLELNDEAEPGEERVEGEDLSEGLPAPEGPPAELSFRMPTSVEPPFTSEELETRLAALPARPGCYIFRDRRGDVLYVGKAKS